MGLFGKKKKEDNITKMFTDSGYQMNEGKLPEQQKRKDVVAAANANRQREIKKDHLLDELNKLRRDLLMTDGYELQSDQVDNLVARLRRMDEIGDKRALSSIDALILNTISAARNQCDRSNYLGVGGYLDVLGDYISDRSTIGTCYYYKDERFIKYTIEKNRFVVIRRTLEAKKGKLEQAMDKLKADYANPALHLSKDAVYRRIGELKADAAQIDAQLSNCDAKIETLDQGLREVKINLDNNINKSNFDIMEEMDDLLEMKRENEMDSTQTDKFNEKLSQSNKKVRSSTLVVNDDVFGSVDIPAELSDDMFKL